jgi:hypothetical protein
MPYDAEDYPVDPNAPPRVREDQPPRDATVGDVETLLEIAALMLTDEPFVEFTEATLTESALGMAGDELIVSQETLRAAMQSCSIIERLPNGNYRQKTGP